MGGGEWNEVAPPLPPPLVCRLVGTIFAGGNERRFVTTRKEMERGGRGGGLARVA